jgi:transposase
MFEVGKGTFEIADIFRVTPGAVSQWKKTWLETGTDGLKAKPKPGGVSRMTDEQRAELRELLVKGPRTNGFDTDLWTLPRIAALIDKHFDIQYESSHVSRILKKLGFSPQKPERRAREQDEEAVAAWRAKDWPRIKEKPAALE